MFRHGRFELPQWRAVRAFVGDDPAGAERVRRRVEGPAGGEHYLWSGCTLTLYKDGAESYWYNLVGKQPSLFIICRPGEDSELEPFIVTANHDEAGAHMEADDAVFSVPMPPELVEPLERWVMQYYVPSAPKRRKRKDWSSEQVEGRAPAGHPKRRR